MDAQAQDRAHRIGQTREVHGEFSAGETDATPWSFKIRDNSLFEPQSIVWSRNKRSKKIFS